VKQGVQEEESAAVLMSLWRWIDAQIPRGSRSSGQGMVEYALILVLVAIVVISVLGLLGTGITNAFQKVVNSLPGSP
jgi:pilus assembly protein Flp/PilA